MAGSEEVGSIFAKGENPHPAPADSTAQRQTTAHYGDPCLYCGQALEAVAVGPCPERAGNREGTRCQFLMSHADYDGIIAAINVARNTPLIAINVGMPRSPQEAANDAWCALGKRLGFDGMSIKPGGGPLRFSAISKATGAA